MTPFLSFLGAAALVAAPVEPGAAGKAARYRKLVDELAWKEPADQPARSLAAQVPSYQLEIRVTISGGQRTDDLAITDHGQVLYSWQEHGHGVAIVRDGLLYRADYEQMATGCAIRAIDLKAGQELWKATLKGLGPIAHSKYHNRVWMERLGDSVLAVYGRESAGRYVELVDFKTGRTVGHKVFPRD